MEQFGNHPLVPERSFRASVVSRQQFTDGLPLPRPFLPRSFPLDPSRRLILASSVANNTIRSGHLQITATFIWLRWLARRKDRPDSPEPRC